LAELQQPGSGVRAGGAVRLPSSQNERGDILDEQEANGNGSRERADCSGPRRRASRQQPGITLYGRIDETIVNSKYSSVSNSVGTTTTNEVKKGDIWSPGNAIGFRGREDLGGGTAAWFQLESGIWPDGRLEASATTGAHFGGRNSAVGVSSELGDILLGIWDTPYKVAYGTGNVVNSGGFASSGSSWATATRPGL